MIHPSFSVSVIVPAYNAQKTLGLCLDAINKSSLTPLEVIVVDDGSTDKTAEIASQKRAKRVRTGSKSGPAAARNLGAGKAKGSILVFVDADVVIRKDTLARIVQDFQEHPEAAAVFGSYDDDPAEEDFVSQFKNLYHHFTHQQGDREAATFWAGCGAVRRDIFERAGGFDENRYPFPSVEDIELGRRIKRMGHRILLDKNIQVKHLKKWNLIDLFKTDIVRRAVPWAMLMLEEGELADDLNLKTSQKISAGLVALMCAVLPAAFFQPKLIIALPALAILLCLINYKWYVFLLKKRGLCFAIRAFPLHVFYYFYSGAVFVVCWMAYLLRRRKLLSRRKGF